MSVADRLRGALRSWRARRQPPPSPPPATTEPLPDWPAWLASRRHALPLYGRIEDGAIARLREHYPEAVANVIAAANDARAHSFVLLGRGPFTPVDPDRPPRGGYEPIDWRLDPACASRFPAGFPHKAWSFDAMRPGNADIKLPWELARCHHWVNLAQAWRLTGDPAYGREVQQQCEDFLEANPVGLGIQWTCTMDVAIRAANWVLAWELLESSAAIDADFRLAWARALYSHAAFIRANLENTYEVTSNHYLSNVVGLYFLGQFFRATAAGRDWVRFARDAIEAEMATQVLEDGSDFESSVPYHRLVTELFLGAARVGQVHGEPFSSAFLERLRRMVGFLLTVIRPDGLMPQFGDADDGRLHVFEGVGRWTPQDPRHLFAPASFIFDEPSWRSVASTASAEAVWWGFAAPPCERFALPATDAAHQEAGIAVSRRGDTYLAITNGIVGTRGFGNHKHNDLLSFEFHAEGCPWFVDPGSYVYTSDPDARNLFRSVRSHNTLSVGGLEQNEMNPAWLFRLFESASPERLSWHATADRIEYAGAHRGFTRDGGPIHERRFTLARASATLLICDILREGNGVRRVVWHFHCAPGVEAAIDGSAVSLTCGRHSRVLRVPSGLAISLADGWYSPSYGVRAPCRVVDCEGSIAFPDAREWKFSFSAGSAAT